MKTPPPMAKPKRPVAPLPPPLPAQDLSGPLPTFNLGEAIKRAKAYQPAGNEQSAPEEGLPDASSQEEQAPQRDELVAPEVKEEIVEEEGQEHELPPLENVDDAESLYMDNSEPEVAVPYNLNQREPKRFAKLRHGHTFHPRLATPSVLDEDWSNTYENCPIFSQIWNEIHGDPEIWPQGIKLFNGKIYREEKLCIPTGLAMRIVGAQHIFGGHLGVEKLVRSLRLRYEFAETTSLWTMAKEIKAMCNTCQACEHPHWKIAGKIEMTPIPPKIMTSVSMDLFSPP